MENLDCICTEEGEVASGATVARLSSAIPDYNPYFTYRMDDPVNVLIVHPDLGLKCKLHALLTRAGHRVTAFSDGLDALEWLGDCLIEGKRLPDLIIADICAPGRKGIDLLADLRYDGWSTPFILLDPKSRRRLEREARRIGGAYVFSVPFETEDFLVAVSYLTRRSSFADYAA